MASGNLQSVLHEQSLQNKQLDTQMVSMSRKTLAKTINRFKMYRQYQAFITWREKVHEYKTYK